MTVVESASCNNGKFQQFLVAIVVNVLSLSSGITWGWPSPVLPQLRSSEPPIGDAPMSEDQISWLSGLMAIGGLIVTPICGVLSERLGRKNFAHLAGLPHVISWLLVIFARDYICICAARLVGGVATAMMMFIVPLYVSEIAAKDIRGSLGSLLCLFVNLGVIFAYVVGAFTSYRLFACLSLGFSLAFVAIFGFLPETPVYLVRQNRPLQAHKSLMFLRGGNRTAVEDELTKLQFQAKSFDQSSDTTELLDLLKNRATRKGLIISFGLLGAQQLSGIFAMISYAETIFQRAGSSISSEMSSITIATIQIVGSYASTMLIDRAGRRLLTLVSCMGMAISHALVALFFCLQRHQYDVSSIAWLPVVAMSIYIVNYCLGIGPVPYVVISEVFSLHVSSLATTLCFVFYWCISFAAIQTFGVAMKLLGVDVCFLMLACFCAASFAFTYCLLPETKSRERQDIVDELAGFGSSRRPYDDDDRGDVKDRPV